MTASPLPYPDPKTPAEVEANYQAGPETGSGQGHFFDRDTMKFFGDKMSSFGVKRRLNLSGQSGRTVLYRKPTAQVNVFGTWHTVGYRSAWLGLWFVNTTTGNLDSTTDEEKAEFYWTLRGA